MIATLLLLTAAPVAAQSAPREALDGIDPVVLLTTGKEVSGKADLNVVRGQFDYLFATPRARRPSKSRLRSTRFS